MKSRPSVALLIESSNAYARSLLRGIIDYVRKHETWSVFLPELERGHEPPPSFAHWKGQGIIARIENKKIAHAIKALEVPVIDLSAVRTREDLPWVETDDAAISKLAFEHLRERGLTRFAFCGEPRFNWSNWRRDYFSELVKENGLECYTFHASGNGNRSASSWNAEMSKLRSWVKSLPKPIGIMACYDIKGQQLLDACRQARIAVPEEVAVIGVDNDELICDLCQPRLSSVIPDGKRAGTIAAGLLDQLMAGHKIEPQAYLVPPVGVEARHSSDITVTDDELVTLALRYIRQHACKGISVDNIAEALLVSRRSLDRRFIATLDRTPHAEITRVRMERVKQLLLETTLPLSVIADRAGFGHVEYLSVAFKRDVGVAPGEFRRERGPSLRFRKLPNIE